MLRRTFTALALLLLVACGGGDHDAVRADSLDTPLNQAHAHNDYLHDRPLIDALEQGFMSVEADIFVYPLLGNEIYVAHSVNEIRPARTLKALYLDPIRERIDTLGQLQPGQDRPVQLLIDFKTQAEPTWQTLQAQLEPYAAYLTRYDNGQIIEGWVTIVISGNRPTDTLASLSHRLAFIDGRISDLSAPPSSDLVPLISDNWANHFNWRGEGVMPHEEYQDLINIVNIAHRNGHRLRFWNTPDDAGAAREALWQVLYDLDVDHINTDDLMGLAQFLRSREQEH